MQVDTNSTPQQLVVDLLGSTRRTFVVTERTAVTKVNVETNQTTPISLDRVFKGDFVMLVVEVGGGSPWPPGTFVNIVEVRAREAQGKLAAINGSEVSFADGRKFALTESARFILGGQFVSQDKLQPGAVVVLRLNPTTGLVTGGEVAGPVSR